MKICAALGFALLMTSARAGSPEAFRGTIFEIETQRQKKLFTVEGVTTWRDGAPETLERVEGHFRDLDGTPAVTEAGLFDEQGVLTSFELTQPQLGEKGRLERKNGKAVFTYEKNGKVRTNEEDWNENIVVGPTLVPYLRRHWDAVLAGEDVEIRFAALDRLETVSFRLFKSEEKKVGDRDAIVVKMRASSLLIAAIVNPLFFTFDKATKKLLELKGRTAPKLRDAKGHWKDLDADIVYE